ncbi:MAG: TolC family protein [Planctomycetota bacterium]
MDTQHRRHLRLRSCLRAVAGNPLWTGLAIVGLGLPGMACGQTTERVTSANRGMVRRLSPSISSDAPGRVVPAKATQPGSWTLSQFEQLALGNHPSLSEYQGKVEAARGRWQQAGLLPNPQVGYSGQQLGSRGLAEQHGVIVQNEFVRGGKLQRGKSVAQQEISQAEMEYAAQELRVLTGVRLAFVEAVSSQQQLQLYRELQQLSQKLYQTTDSLFQAKEASRADLIQARLEVEQSKILVQNAQQRQAAAWRGLAAAAGQSDLPAEAVDGDLTMPRPEYDWDAILQRIMTGSPELAASGSQVERARAAVDKARADRVQNVTVQGIVQYDNSIALVDGAVQVTMPVPVFNRNQGTIREAEGNLIESSHAYRRLELNLRAKLALVYERYSTAQSQVDQYEKEILPAARESLDLTLTAYREGQLGFVNLLTAQRTYFQTSIAYQVALRDLWLATYEMDGLLLVEKP